MACQCLGSVHTMSAVATVTPRLQPTRKALRTSTYTRSVTFIAAGLPTASSSCVAQLVSSRSGALPVRVACTSRRQRRQVRTQAYSQKPDIADRVVASVPYLIPLCDGLRYGKRICNLQGGMICIHILASY